MLPSEIIRKTLENKQITQQDLAEKIHTTKQNLSNKLSRDNFSTVELVEIADALKMQLQLKDKEAKKEYVIDYPAERKGKPKRVNKTNQRSD